MRNLYRKGWIHFVVAILVALFATVNFMNGYFWAGVITAVLSLMNLSVWAISFRGNK